MDYLQANKTSKSKQFMLTLVGPSRLWLNTLPYECMESWTDLCKIFASYFTTTKRKPLIISFLNMVTQGNKESLHFYNKWFTQVVVEVEGAIKGLKWCIFENGLLHSPFMEKLERKMHTMHELLNKTQSFTNLEEKLTPDLTTQSLSISIIIARLEMNFHINIILVHIWQDKESNKLFKYFYPLYFFLHFIFMHFFVQSLKKHFICI